MDRENLQKRTFPVLARICIFFVIIQLLSSFTIFAHAQPEISFSALDEFEIPSNNSSIRFASNGTYESAVLEWDAWTFEGLYFPTPRVTEKLDVTVSATDCNVPIGPYRIFNYTSRDMNVKWLIIRYTVLGQGTQVFNIGVDPIWDQVDVILNEEYTARNHGWTLTPDGTLTVTGATANVTLWFYWYPNAYSENVDLVDSHYVLISSTGSAVAVVVLAAVITRKRKQEPITN